MTNVVNSKADVQRRRIGRIAAEIFSSRGYRATSMNEVAARAGLAKPTLYHYFRSKEELLVRIYEEVLDESLAGVQATAASCTTPIEGLRALIVERVIYTCTNKELLKVCFEEEEELSEALVANLLVRRRAFEAVFRNLLESHLQASSEDIGVPATIFVNTCLGAINWIYKWYRPEGPNTPEELGQAIATVLLGALESKTPATAEGATSRTYPVEAASDTY